MSPHEPGHAAAGIPLQAHVEELRSRCEAALRLQGGSTYYREELGIFRSYAEETGLFLTEPPAELSRPPDDEGNEHQVWYLPEAEAFLKATWPDFFGLLVIHRPHEEQKASPIAYLERWHLHNQLFGDQVSFLGALQTDAGLRLLKVAGASRARPLPERLAPSPLPVRRKGGSAPPTPPPIAGGSFIQNPRKPRNSDTARKPPVVPAPRPSAALAPQLKNPRLPIQNLKSIIPTCPPLSPRHLSPHPLA